MSSIWCIYKQNKYFPSLENKKYRSHETTFVLYTQKSQKKFSFTSTKWNMLIINQINSNEIDAKIFFIRSLILPFHLLRCWCNLHSILFFLPVLCRIWYFLSLVCDLTFSLFSNLSFWHISGVARDCSDWMDLWLSIY